MNPTINDIRIVIADDHEIFRDGFRLMLSKQNDIHLVAEAENGQQLLAIAKEHLPDVIITDIKMPIMDGVEATKKLAELYPNIGVIGLSMFNEDDLIVEMLEAGAKGYLLKNANKQQIIEAIKTVYSGDPYYCKSTSNKLTQMIARSRYNPYKHREKVNFSERELEVIDLVFKEMTNKEIADKLCTSERTIEGIRKRIMTKMNVKSAIGFVVYVMKENLLKTY